MDGAGSCALEAAPEVGIVKGCRRDGDGAGAAEGSAWNEAGGVADPLAGEKFCRIGREGEGGGGEGGKDEAGGYVEDKLQPLSHGLQGPPTYTVEPKAEQW